MEDAAPIGKRAARSFVASSSRHLATLLVYAATSIALTRLTVPEVYGAYAIVGSLALLIQHLVSGPLGTAFIVASAPPRPRAISCAFWFTATVMTGIAVVLGGLAALTAPGVWSWLMAGLAVNLLFAPLRFPAVVVFYRQLQLGRLAVIEMAAVTAFSAVSILLVYLGFGSRSFAAALMLEGLVAGVGSIALCRWRPSPPSLRGIGSILREARPFAAAAATQLSKDQLTLPLVGLIAGAHVAGLYSWAFTSVVAGLIAADLLGSVLLSAFARLRADRPGLQDAAVRSLRVVTAMACGLVVVIAGCASPLVHVVFSERWEPAIPILLVLAPAMIIQAIASVPLYLATSDGRAGAAARWRVGGLAVFWAGAIPAGMLYGGVGIAVAYGAGTAVVCIAGMRDMLRQYGAGRAGLVRLGAVALAAYLAAELTAAGLGDTVISLLAAATLALAVFVAGALTAVPALREDLRRALRLVQRGPRFRAA